MKHQALFSFEDEGKKLECPLLQFMFGALRVNNGYNLLYLKSSIQQLIIVIILKWLSFVLQFPCSNASKIKALRL